MAINKTVSIKAFAFLGIFLPQVWAGSSEQTINARQELKIDLLVSRGSISGEVMEIREVQSDEFWGAHAIVVRSNEGDSTIFAWIGETSKLENVRVGIIGTFPVQASGNKNESLAIWNGGISFYPGIVLGREEVEALLLQAETEARAVLSGFQPCSAEHLGMLDNISSAQVQDGIDSIFKEGAASSSILECLISNIDSTRPINSFSFKPPWAGLEGTYHHGFSSLGQLIAYLLPNLTGRSIYPPIPPSSPKELESIKFSWSLWYGHRQT